MMAPASVPHVMTLANFHHNPPSRSWISRYDAAYVHAIEMSDAIHTSDRSGLSKFIVRASLYLLVAIALLIRYAAPLATTITRRITKIQTSSFTWLTSLGTASRLNVISATPVT